MAKHVQATIMPIKCHIPKLFNVNMCKMYANIYATFEFTGIIHMIRVLYTDDNNAVASNNDEVQPQPLRELPLAKSVKKSQFQFIVLLPFLSATNLPHRYHTPKLLDVVTWRKYGNLYATCEVVPINDVARIAVHVYHRIATHNNNDETTAQQHSVSWPLGQISQ